MRIIACFFLLALAFTAPLAAGSLLDADIAAVLPGNEAFEISRVAGYEGRWQQFDRASGAPLNSYAESLLPMTVEGQPVLEHRMVIDRPGGGQVINRSHHDPATFVPLGIISEMIGGPSDQPAKRVVAFTDSGYTLSSHGAADQANEIAVPVSVKGFNAGNLGLAIAGLPLAKGYQARLPAVMPQFRGSYWTVVSVTGETRFKLDKDSAIDAWLVDVDWLHLESGDVYPGGPDGSGGRYTIAKQFLDGQPRVLRYLTDTSDVRLVNIEASP